MMTNRAPGTAIATYDPLTYLPRKPVQEFARRRVIYDHHQASDYLFLVILGRVKITNISEDGGQTIARIVCSEGLFGEACLIGKAERSESATALDTVSVMCWSSAEIERHIEHEPRLGLALSQYMVRECIELQDRIESMAVHKTPERVMLSLIQLAHTLGEPNSDGSTRISALTHHTIAEFVGTSREIVTFQLNRLRRLGMLRYSRKFMDIYVDAMCGNLREQGIELPLVVRGSSTPAIA
jgi:CRP/FNR family transcriptional regulator, cyclic AMP receptor protein